MKKKLVTYISLIPETEDDPIRLQYRLELTDGPSFAEGLEKAQSEGNDWDTLSIELDFGTHDGYHRNDELAGYMVLNEKPIDWPALLARWKAEVEAVGYTVSRAYKLEDGKETDIKLPEAQISKESKEMSRAVDEQNAKNAQKILDLINPSWRESRPR
jgi:hypothetical protein